MLDGSGCLQDRRYVALLLHRYYKWRNVRQRFRWELWFVICDLRLRQNITHNGIFVIFFSQKMVGVNCRKKKWFNSYRTNSKKSSNPGARAT